MNQLPPEVWYRVLDFIPYSNLRELRLVNRLFDQLVTRQFNAISFVRFAPQSNSALNSDAYRSSISNVLKFRKFILRTRQCKDDCRLMDFVAEKLTGVKGLDFYDTYQTIKISSLLRFARNLQYFRAYRIQMDVQFEQVDEILQLFPRLVAFDVTYSEYPFCVNLWAERTRESFIQWHSKCDHEFICGATGARSNATKCVKLFRDDDRLARSVQLSQLPTSLEMLDVEDVAATISLSLSNLKYFNLKAYHIDIEVDTLLLYIANSRNLRFLQFNTHRFKNSSALSLLSFVNSLRHLVSVIIWVNKLVKRNDKSRSQHFEYCEKPKLRHVQLSFGQFSNAHFTQMKSLLDSSDHLDCVDIRTQGEVETHVSMNYHQQSAVLSVTTVGPANLKQLLDILVPRYNKVDRLHLSTKKGVDASFAETVLKFSRLRNLEGFYTEGFVRRWLPLLTQSQNEKSIQFDTRQYDLHVLSHEVHDLLVESVNSGALKRFYSRWLCPKRTACTCGLGREFYNSF